MQILNCEQRSDEWFKARLGVPTASNFDKIVTTKGEPSKSRKAYLYKLAGEAVSGSQEDIYQSQAMLRGTELESEAVEFYQMVKSVSVDPVGFCLTEGRHTYGASPDGLVGEDGSIEIKCPLMATHVGYLIDNKLPTKYIQQVQGQLLVTGKKWTDFISYYAGLRPLIIRVEPDKKLIALMKAEIEIFCQDLEKTIKQIRQEK
jgi:putative phage-type endonuclease